MATRIYKNIIITADWHLTDKQDDSYRFGIFPWLANQCKKRSVTPIIILGDLTDQKDYHSAYLVTKIAEGFKELSKQTDIILLRGNHDFRDLNYPFFKFLETLTDSISYITEPTIDSIYSEDDTLFLPYEKEPHKTWSNLIRQDYFKGVKFIFLHQTFKGAVASNGVKLDGLSHRIFDHTKARIFSGDIHVPQRIGKVTYVGSPYRVHFGDTFKPRLLLLDDNEQDDLHFPCPNKHLLDITSPEECSDYDFLEPNDLVKIRLHLLRSQLSYWPKYKKEIEHYCDKLGVILSSLELKVKDNLMDLVDKKPKILTKEAAFENYCNRTKVDETFREIGKELMEISK